MLVSAATAIPVEISTVEITESAAPANALARRLWQAGKLWRIGLSLFVCSFCWGDHIEPADPLQSLGEFHRPARDATPSAKLHSKASFKAVFLSYRPVVRWRPTRHSRPLPCKIRRGMPLNGLFQGSKSCEWRYGGGWSYSLCHHLSGRYCYVYAS